MHPSVTTEAWSTIPRPDEVVDILRPRIDRMAAYFGRHTGVDEDDLRQEAWLAVLETLPRLDLTVGAPEQHLLKRAKWRILDTVRRQRRRMHLPLAEAEAQAITFDSMPGIDLAEILTRLTTIQRRILRALMEGYTWREAGAHVGCTSANVAYHVRRIREVYRAMDSDPLG